MRFKPSKHLVTLLLILGTTNYTFAQDDESDEQKDSVGFFVGVNIGAHFANKKTAVIYSGAPNITPFGINYIFSLPQNQQTFNDYFQYPYSISEYPFESRYETTAEIGFQLGYRFNSDISVFAEVNTLKLKYKQVFTVEIDDPNNQMVGPTFEQLPIFGEESRFNLNIGTQLSMYNAEGVNCYFSLFGNINDVELDRNYIVVNNRSYEIFHQDITNPNNRPGGIGYGGGAGLGIKLNLTEKILTDFYYNLYYTKNNFNENLQPFGTHHSLGLRVLWNL